MLEAVDVQERRNTLAEAYPGWTVRPSANGEAWIATRFRDLSDREFYHGLHRTLICDNATELAERLAEQARRERDLAKAADS